MCIVSSHYIYSNIIIQYYVRIQIWNIPSAVISRFIKCTEPYTNGAERANYTSEFRVSNSADFTEGVSFIKTQNIIDVSLGYIFLIVLLWSRQRCNSGTVSLIFFYFFNRLLHPSCLNSISQGINPPSITFLFGLTKQITLCEHALCKLLTNINTI